MKNFSLFLLTALSFFSVSAQTANSTPKEPPPPPPGPYQWNQLVDAEWKSDSKNAGANWDIPGIKGTMFFNDFWAKGYLVIDSKSVMQDIPLRFNIYTNQIYFQHDSNTLVIDSKIPVSEFGLKADSLGNEMSVFRCGFPGNLNGNEKTYYQVLVQGNYALLKHYGKKIIEHNDLSSGPEKLFLDSETYLVFNSLEKTMTPVSKNRKSFQKALPKLSDKIDQVLQHTNNHLKTENDLISLIAALNNSQ